MHADSSAIVINGSWNKRSGPGGGTRRLHQQANLVATEGAK